MPEDPAKSASSAPGAEEAIAESSDAVIDDKNMYVKVYAPFKVYFDGPAVSVSAVNDTGPFDILKRHHNFMTLVNQCDLIIRTQTEEKKIQINRGVMHVKADRVVVFLDV